MELIIGILGTFFQGILLMIGLLTGMWVWFKIWFVLDWLTTDFVRIIRIKYKRWKRNKGN